MGSSAAKKQAGTVMLTFSNLYDDVWGVIEKPKYYWENPKIIMPQNFQPELEKTYECHVHETMTGTFNYNGIDYDLCYASWVEAGSVIDVTDFKVENKAPRNNPFADALKNIDRSKLTQVEMVTLTVQEDQKNGGLMFAPQYLDKDPHANGLPSMRFFIPVNKVNLQRHKSYHARVQRIRDTGRETKRRAIILNVFVEVV